MDGWEYEWMVGNMDGYGYGEEEIIAAQLES